MKQKDSYSARKQSGRRRQARELALQLLYAMEITGSSVADILAGYTHLSMSGKVSLNDFTQLLLEKVKEHQEELDQALQKVIANWRLDRLSHIDRNLLRLAVAEIYYFDDIPPKVTINEYIEIAKDFGDDDSPSFVNGIMDRVARESPKGGEIERGKNGGAGGGT